ncbi:AAA family ATPase [Fibrobacter sp. UWEL]|uniref:AAA family ATPase n=1 Tax=Fibrobacter sp. UWEL TaxID=1896209 RepID=UPI0009160E20|nr:AAA family ATPase [Fibrobacter sp. UWEL]SHK87723.1 AAA domain (dynein-related subfamily) [Fibrobacter sp. UWEL]
MSYEELIQKLSELQLGVEYPYVPSSTSSEQNKYKLVSVSAEAIKVIRDGSEVSVSIQQMKTILENLRPNVPLDIEKLLGSSGNTRSIIESLLCLTPSIFHTKLNRRKHIVLLTEKSHELGALSAVEESEVKGIVALNTLTQQILRESEFKDYLTRVAKSKRTGKSFSPSAVSSYLIFIRAEKLFDYDPSSWTNIQSVYDIDSVDEVVSIISKLHSSKSFKDRNKKDNNGWRYGAINQYRDFLIYKNQNLSSLDDADDEPVDLDEGGNMECMQKIFFGAPGTGKSHKIDAPVSERGCGLKLIPGNRKFRTTFHPDYDYAQFVGSYKPKSVCDASSVGIQDPGNLSIGDLIDIAKKMHDDEIAHPYARLGTLYYKSLKALSKSMVGAKKEICDKSGDGMDNGPELNTGIFIGEYLEENVVPKETKIAYSFVPQVFAKAYAAAWNKFIAAGEKSTADNQVYLVIEEINRGNCAQIFGDLFQLLDRDENGYSSYAIDADADFAEWIEKQLDSSAAPQNDIPEEIHSGRKLRLPPNFNILATMNTSDQSLFPMDSAFKRRFDWEYVPIDFEGKDCASYQIKVDDENSYPWQKFVESVNEKIVSITDSEDKQLGEYFIKLNPADNNVITKERFLGKVMFYLWNEVCKDVHKQESFFREEENGNYFTFQDLYKKDGDKKLISFMDWITK